MIIGLHDADRKQFKHKTFPNYALMKISAWESCKMMNSWNFRRGICMEDVTLKRIGRNIVRERDLILNM